MGVQGMAKMSLIEGIQEYARATDSLGIPSSELEKQKFEEYLAEHNIRKDSKLNLSSLRKLANEINAKKLKTSITFYTRLAKAYGIEYYDTGDNAETDLSIAVGDYLDVPNEEGDGIEESTENIENISDIEGEEAEMTPEEMIAKGLAGMMLQNRNVTIEIGQETLRNIQSILCKEPEKTSKFTWSIGHNIEETFKNSIHGYDFNELKQILDIKRSMLLRGVPGTGKTKIMKLLINQLAEGDKSRYKIISFSQGTDYTDFIGGLVSKNGNWEYKDGILTELCKLADKHRENNYYLGIDEVSRGNTEAIFGELMTCIEHRDTIVTLKNGDEFMIPSNLYIIGTMNNLDGSTKKIDVATLERFYIVDIVPQWKDYAYALTKDIEVTDELFTILDTICICMEQINELIENSKELGPDKCIGIRAVSGIKLTKENLKIAVESHLIPEINDRIKYCRSNKNDIEDLKKEIQKLFE